MNFLKIYKSPLFFGQGGLLKKKKQVLSLVHYSRNSSNSKSPYKIVQAKIKNSGNEKVITHENGANWELFGPKNNRFFLAGGSSGPAYLNHLSTHGPADLDELICFKNKDKGKLHIKFGNCPVLIRRNLQEMFPAPEVLSEHSNLSLITLSQAGPLASEHEQSAMKFVLASREICQRLRLHGYWSDFLNPFSGKAFFSYHQKSLYKNDERFRGLCMKLESIKGFGSKDDCLLISEDKSTKFSGSIFTNLPSMEMFKELVIEDEI